MSEASQSSRLLVFQTSKRNKKRIPATACCLKNQPTTHKPTFTHRPSDNPSHLNLRIQTCNSKVSASTFTRSSWSLAFTESTTSLSLCLGDTSSISWHVNWLLWNNVKCAKWWKKLKKKHGKKKQYHVTRVSTAFTIWRIPLQKSCPRTSAPLPLCSVFPRSG